jgi:hypothetical protein
MKMVLKRVRLSFPQIWKAQQVNGEGEPAFNANFIIEDLVTAASVDKVIEQVAKDKWGAKADAHLLAIRSKDKTCLHDGSTKDYDGYAGNFFVSARSPTQPLILDRDKTPLNQISGRPYGGCYVNASVDIYAQDNDFGKRINAQLRGIQFVADGEAFGAGPASADEFEELDEEEGGLA